MWPRFLYHVFTIFLFLQNIDLQHPDAYIQHNLGSSDSDNLAMGISEENLVHVILRRSALL